jgi:hypothetical protein
MIHTSTPYQMSLEEFATILLPALCRYSFIPQASELASETIKNLWLASLPITDATCWDDRYKARDARDALIAYMHPAGIDTCCSLRRNFETLKNAKNGGCVEVKVCVKNGCRCQSQFDGLYLLVSDALDAYERNDAVIPFLPLIDTECGYKDSPQTCEIFLIPQESSFETDDSEFSKWLNEHLRLRK